jgi:hypothetical protein
MGRFLLFYSCDLSPLFIKAMRAKMFKMRGCTSEKGQTAFVELDVEFEGKRAFAIWDSVSIGNYFFKARLELNPRLLKKIKGKRCDYLYRGRLVLPRPQDN